MKKSNILPLPRERRLEILAELQQEGAVRVGALAERFSVAEETIRRDLDKLGEEGHLARTHGGALSVRRERFDLPSAVRKSSHTNEKQRIAQQALSHIEPHDILAFDASTTVLELVCLLPDMPLTVITYSLDAVHLLADRPQIKVISTGGELDSNSLCLLGPVAEETIRHFSINKFFCSSKGIDLERGYSEASTSHASIKGLIMQLADHVTMLADHSKFGVRSMAYSGKLQSADVVITDDATDIMYLDTLANVGVETEVVAVKSLSL